MNFRLTDSPRSYRTEFFRLCRRVLRADLEETATSAVEYYRSAARQREDARPFRDLENRWYASIEAGEPDYAVYSSPEMVAETWACWEVYSRKYLLLLQQLGIPAGSVCDLGCGCGLTTTGLMEVYPHSRVFGTQLPGTPQWRIAARLAEVRPAPEEAELVVASEFFEHFREPIACLRDVLKTCRPRALLIASSFGSRSVGHFPVYFIGRKAYPRGIGRLFNKELRARGYKMLDTGFWNNRPQIWTRD
jgi:hypothetical protein